MYWKEPKLIKITQNQISQTMASHCEQGYGGDGLCMYGHEPAGRCNAGNDTVNPPGSGIAEVNSQINTD